MDINSLEILLNLALSKITDDPKAYCLNLYENENQNYSVELVATNSYYKSDNDWACDEMYASRNDNLEYFFAAKDWKSALKIINKEVLTYLEKGMYAQKIKKADGLAYGFVDGDLIRIKT